MMNHAQQILTSAEAAARAAGQLLLDMQDQVKAREKGPKDLVTEADLAAQDMIRRRLAQDFPNFQFVGEEDPESLLDRSTDQPCWVVDPLDGTTNYVHGMTDFSVSIALQSEGDVQVGVVYHPAVDQLYHAIRGQGAFRNGTRLAVSQIQPLKEALVAASFSPQVSPDSPEIQRLLRVLYHSQAVRRMGSAALNLCYVAAGQLDAYWATTVKIWDVAAGLLFVQEAGGMITSLDGSAVELERPKFLASSTPALHRELLSVLQGEC